MSKRKSGETQQYIAYCNLAGIFKEAKKLIKRKRYHFICDALKWGLAVDYGIGSQSTINAATDLIQSRLDGHSTLESWMAVNTVGYHALIAANSGLADRCMRRTRLAWLDSLVAEFEAKAKKELKRGKRKS